MRYLRSAIPALTVSALLGAAASQPAFAQNRPPVVPEPSSLVVLGAGTIALILVVCWRIVVLRRQAAKEGS
jgi:hypothetical protein